MSHTNVGACFLLSLVSFLALASPAVADPRWWWNDAFVASSSGDIPSLDIDVWGLSVGGIPPMAIFVAWVDQSGAPGGSVKLTASFDQGCTFCTVRVLRLTSGSPEVALAVVPNFEIGAYTIQLLVTDGSRALVVYDAVSVPLDATPEEKCAALTDLRANRTVLALSDQPAASPDIVGTFTAEAGVLHFHSLWRQSTPTHQWEVRYARDLAGDGSGWEDRGPLTDAAARPEVSYPRVSADLLYEGPGPTSSVNVVFVDPAAGEVLYLRSADSGTNFSASGEAAPGPPAVINDASTGRAVGPMALDSGIRGGYPLWHGALWYEERDAQMLLLVDGQYQTGPDTAASPWRDPDLSVDLLDPGGDVGPAISVSPGGSGPWRAQFGPARMFLVWTDSSSGGYDLFYRGGVLDAVAPDPIDLDASLFWAARPTDPTVSTNLQLTACSWDEGTGDCIPDRATGGARRAAIDEETGSVFLA